MDASKTALYLFQMAFEGLADTMNGNRRIWSIRVDSDHYWQSNCEKPFYIWLLESKQTRMFPCDITVNGLHFKNVKIESLAKQVMHIY